MKTGRLKTWFWILSPKELCCNLVKRRFSQKPCIVIYLQRIWKKNNCILNSKRQLARPARWSYSTLLHTYKGVKHIANNCTRGYYCNDVYVAVVVRPFGWNLQCRKTNHLAWLPRCYLRNSFQGRRTAAATAAAWSPLWSPYKNTERSLLET